MVQNIELEADQEQEDPIEMVNINSINFNANHFVITANLKTPSNKVVIKVWYKVDTDGEWDIMPFKIYNIYLGQHKSNWWQQEIKISN